MDESAGKVTGEHQWSVDESFAALYAELRTLAHSRLQHNEPITLLNTTALVHESYLGLVQAGGVKTWDRPQYLAYAASAMPSLHGQWGRRGRLDWWRFRCLRVRDLVRVVSRAAFLLFLPDLAATGTGRGF